MTAQIPPKRMPPSAAVQPTQSPHEVVSLNPYPRTTDPFADVREKRMSELNAEQTDRAYELWAREQLGWVAASSRDTIEALLRVIDRLRAVHAEAPSDQKLELNRLLNKFAQACTFGDDHSRRMATSKAIHDFFNAATQPAEAPTASNAKDHHEKEMANQLEQPAQTSGRQRHAVRTANRVDSGGLRNEVGLSQTTANNAERKAVDVDWNWASDLMDAASHARSQGFTVGTSNWSAFIWRYMHGKWPTRAAQQEARPDPLLVLSDFVQRATHWQEGGADRHSALLAIRKLERTQR